MKKYCVTFYQCTNIEVEAENEDDALQNASPEFDRAMRRPIAHTDYDDVEVREVTDEG